MLFLYKDQLLLFREIISVYFENNTKPIVTLCEHNDQF
jgi:hypothetical protein